MGNLQPSVLINCLLMKKSVVNVGVEQVGLAMDCPISILGTDCKTDGRTDFDGGTIGRCPKEKEEESVDHMHHWSAISLSCLICS